MCIEAHGATQGIDSRRWTMLCVCDRCLLAVKLSLLTLDPPSLNVL